MTGEVLTVEPPHELMHRWGDDMVRRRLAPTDTASGRVVGQDAGQHGWESLRDVYPELLGV